MAFVFTVDKSTAQPLIRGVINSRVTSYGMDPHTRIFRSNLQLLPAMIKRTLKPIRAMAWGLKKLNLDRRLSMKVRIFVFGGGTVPQMLPVYVIPRVYSEYRAHLVLRVLRVLQYWRLKYC